MNVVLRDRATVVVIRDNLVLLARDEGTDFFNMPGGGIEPGEPREEAATRELQEETGLIARGAEALFVWDSTSQRHHVYRIETRGEARTGGEVAELLWWDGERAITTSPHVEVILERLRFNG